MIRQQIHDNHNGVLVDRAEYLYGLYDSRSIGGDTTESHLDIGCGKGVNSSIFGVEYEQTVCVDVSRSELDVCSNDLIRVQASAATLPFVDSSFNLVTAISLIEHVENQSMLLSEAMRVLKPGGELVIQFPNRWFFMELHTGIPFYGYLPKWVSPYVADVFGCSGLRDIDIPNPKDVMKSIKRLHPNAGVKIKKVVYPIEIIPKRFRFLYSTINRMHGFKWFPFGWMIVCTV